MKHAGTLALGLALLIHYQTALAKTASQVFEQVSGSVVVVHGLDTKGKQTSQGSGVVLPGGEVATNCHVIEDAKHYRVKYRGQAHEASVKHTDWDRDVCTLTASGLKAPSASLGSTKGLKVGAKVFAVGAPQGLELSLSEGIVSSLREVDSGRYIQTTAPISPGSSGGGLFDEEGRLLGLPTFYLAEGQQLNFAVPVEWVNELPKRHTANMKGKQTLTEWLNKALALQEAENWPEALRHAQRWTKAVPGSDSAWFHVGLAHYESGQTAKAIEAFQRSLSIDPEDESTWNNLGIAYKKSGQTDKAIESYQQALRINPEHTNAWYNLGNAYDDSGQTAKAIEAYQQALRIEPEYANAWYNLGNAYDDSGQTAKAIKAYEQVLRINPEDAKSWVNVGVAYGNSGQTTRAIKAYEQALRIDPEDVKAWNNLGVAFKNSGQTAKAIESYQQAIRIDPGDSAAWVNLGVAYNVSGQRSQVIEVYRRLQSLDKALAEKFFSKIVMP